MFEEFAGLKKASTYQIIGSKSKLRLFSQPHVTEENVEKSKTIVLESKRSYVRRNKTPESHVSASTFKYIAKDKEKSLNAFIDVAPLQIESPGRRMIS